MDTEFKTLAPLLRTLWAETEKGGGTMLFCQSNNQEVLAENILGHLQNLGRDHSPTVNHYSLTSYKPKPYAPFLDECKHFFESYNAGEILTFLNQHQVYYYHSGVLTEYLSSGTAIRREGLLPGELDYESFRMQGSIRNILQGVYASHPVIFLIENAHNLPRSTLRLLKMILKSGGDLPFLCILCAPEVVQNITEAEDSPWNRLLELADQRGLVLNFRSQGHSEMVAENLPRNRQILEDPQFYDGINAYYLLALEDSERVFQSFIDLQLYHRALPHVKYQVWKYLGLVDYHRGLYETARQRLENALTVAQLIDEEQLLSEAYQLLGSAYLGLSQFSYAKKMARLAFRNAKEAGDRERLFHALFLHNQIDDVTRPDDLEANRSKYRDAVQLAKELGMENSYTFLLSSLYGISRAIDEDRFQESGYPALTIARKRDNRQRQADMYHILGMACINRGEYPQVLKYYRKSRKLKAELPDACAMATTNNGIGFFYFYQGDYKKAQRNFTEALDGLRNTKNYHEIAMTLYNLALNAFLARKFEHGVAYGDACLNIMKILKFESLSFHSKAAIMILLGLNLIQSGNALRAWQIQVQVQLEHEQVLQSKAEELFLSHLFRALHFRDGGDYAGAFHEFSAAEQALVREQYADYYLYPMFYLEYGDFYLLQNKKNEAKQSFKSGLEAAKGMGNVFYIELLESRVKAMRLSTLASLRGMSEIDVEWTLNRARMQSSLTALRKRLDDINQLNMLFAVVAEETNQSELIHRTVDLIYNQFEPDFDVIIYLSRKRKEFQQVYIREKTPIAKNEEFSLLIRHISELPEQVRFSPGMELQQFKEVVKQYGGVLSISVNPTSEPSGLILCFTRQGEIRLRPESLQLFSLVGQQFGLALQKLHQQQTIMLQNQELKQKNDLLKQSSTTDYLTNLGNRASLYDVLEYEISRIKRYSRDGKTSIALLFIDLDNFKFFNDTYGHAAGDALLVQVSRTIRGVIRHIDTAFRYGGDEFVVILPETDEDGAGELGQRLIKEIETCDSYRSNLEELLARDIVVPEDQRLSCSIGIASSNRMQDVILDVDSFINTADKALYQAKLLGKHRVYMA
jgi:diguanylate cyclase (GGDEF)-like protein